jgi:Reverse transcriptase (RNA-dependent DNA polymerase)
MVQIYAGKQGQYTKAYPMKSESEIASTLQHLIRQVGAPNLLFSDNAKAEIGKAVTELLRYYSIKDHQSEPGHQHQNYAERVIQEILRYVNVVMERTGTPPDCWLLCLLYVVDLMNHLSRDSLDGRTPIEATFNYKPDVSPYLYVHWWQPVYYAELSQKNFPSKSKERTGRIVGIAWDKGDLMTFMVLDDETRYVSTRSYVRPIDNENPNFVAMSDEGEEYGASQKPILQSVTEAVHGVNPDSSDIELFPIKPDDLVGTTFLHQPEENGAILRARIVRKIEERDADNRRKALKFLVEIGDNEYDEIMTYNDLIDIVEKRNEAELNGEAETHAYREFVGFQGPLKASDPRYNGSSWNLLVHWEDGSQTWEPLKILIADDPVSVAAYGKSVGLLDQPGWKRLKRIARRENHFKRMVKHSKIAPSRNVPLYKFGIELPRTIKDVFRIDEKNHNRRWRTACDLEIELLKSYQTFHDLGKHAPTPKGYKHIRLHWVFDVKEDGRHRARLVAGGHLTDVLKESAYSGVVSLRSLRMCVLLAEMNDLKINATDISSAYLEAKTKEKLTITAGPEFGELAGHTLIIVKALYGLRSSGARWHELLADTLREMGFIPCKSDPDVWMRNAIDHWEYVCVYVDDLAIMMKDPAQFFKDIKAIGGYNLKGTDEIRYHIGGDFFRDTDGTLCYGAKTYINRLKVTFERLFPGEKLHPFKSPLEPNDHPELDQTPELDEEGIAKYQSLIGALQWAVSLCRWDIHQAVMTLGRFRAAPKEGHMKSLKRIAGYLALFQDAAIRFNTAEPDYSGMQEMKMDWSYSVYGKGKEEIPADMPKPLGKAVTLTCFVDANLMHDFVTGRSATGVLHLMNSTPIDWFSKRQDTVETATYGSEFVAARIATEQIMDIRNTLRYMGMPVKDKTYLFGDNEGVIKSSTLPHSVLKKRHNMLAFHRVREAIAMGILRFIHINGKENPSDVLTKPLSHGIAYPLIKPFLFACGDTLKKMGIKTK